MTTCSNLARAILARYAITIFLSAFLLFAVQPLVSRMLTPHFGGTASVWTSCLVFFQLTLLAGYFYTHVVRRWLSPRYVWVLQMALLALAAVCIRLTELPSTSTEIDQTIFGSVFQSLALSIGLPFFALSTTGPLVQTWSDLSHPAHNPYRLYALSNVGSLLALLAYPFAIEPYLPLSLQTRIWTILFFVFCVSAYWSSVQTHSHREWRGPSAGEATASAGATAPGFLWFVWLGLSAAGSLLLMATTNIVTQEVASFPFLWVLPLALYLTTFIISFEYPQCYDRRWAFPLFLVASAVGIILFHLGTKVALVYTTIGMGSVCFLGCWVCHGELYRLKPATAHLTGFYLWVAVGGAVGGLFVAVGAPRVFNGLYELHLALIVAVALAGTLIAFGQGAVRQASAVRGMVLFGALAALGIVGSSIAYQLDPEFQRSVVFRDRNEYGVVSVVDAAPFRYLVNGQTIHGGQSLNESFQDLPNLYYVAGSGAEVAFTAMRQQRSATAAASRPAAAPWDGTLDVGVLGLGTGTLAAWGQAGDRFVFYELNPLVIEVATRYFSYVPENAVQGDSNRRGVRVQVIPGDGRRCLVARPPDAAKFDLLFIDAFTSDSIPMHLLTVEAVQLYRKHMVPDGLLVFHVTNRFVDLLPVLRGVTEELGLATYLVEQQNPDVQTTTRWVIVTGGAVPVGPRLAEFRTSSPLADRAILWTDDRAALAPVVLWSDSGRGKPLTIKQISPDADTSNTMTQ